MSERFHCEYYVKGLVVFDGENPLTPIECCSLLNNYYQEFEHKSNILLKENRLLWSEINNLMKQDCRLSDEFEEYLDSVSTEYGKFWRRKLETAKKQGVI